MKAVVVLSSPLSDGHVSRRAGLPVSPGGRKVSSISYIKAATFKRTSRFLCIMTGVLRIHAQQTKNPILPPLILTRKLLKLKSDALRSHPLQKGAGTQARSSTYFAAFMRLGHVSPNPFSLKGGIAKTPSHFDRGARRFFRVSFNKKHTRESNDHTIHPQVPPHSSFPPPSKGWRPYPKVD